MRVKGHTDLCIEQYAIESFYCYVHLAIKQQEVYNPSSLTFWPHSQCQIWVQNNGAGLKSNQKLVESVDGFLVR